MFFIPLLHLHLLISIVFSPPPPPPPPPPPHFYCFPSTTTATFLLFSSHHHNHHHHPRHISIVFLPPPPPPPHFYCFPSTTTTSTFLLFSLHLLLSFPEVEEGNKKHWGGEIIKIYLPIRLESCDPWLRWIREPILDTMRYWLVHLQEKSTLFFVVCQKHSILAPRLFTFCQC